MRQNAITPGVVRKIVQYLFFFFFNKPTLQLECMNSRMFLQLYFIKRMGNSYRSVITFTILVVSRQSFVINPRYSDLNITNDILYKLIYIPMTFIHAKEGITSKHLYVHVENVILYAPHIFHRLTTKYWSGTCSTLWKCMLVVKRLKKTPILA